jgi:hypothetical protein
LIYCDGLDILCLFSPSSLPDQVILLSCLVLSFLSCRSAHDNLDTNPTRQISILLGILHMHPACQLARILSKLQMAVLPGLVGHELPTEAKSVIDVAEAELNRVDLISIGVSIYLFIWVEKGNHAPLW